MCYLYSLMKSSYDDETIGVSMGLTKDKTSMVRPNRMGWGSALFIGVIFLISSGVLADKGSLSSSSQFLQCQTSLKRFCLHLENCSKTRINQPYYENLYNQTQDFLKTLENLPSSSSQLDQLVKCENLLKVVQDVIGHHHAGAPDLAPMPAYSNPNGGTLTNPVLETIPKRPLRRVHHVQYEYDNASLKQSTKEVDEEAGEVDEFGLSSPNPSPSPRLSRTRKPGESQELE